MKAGYIILGTPGTSDMIWFYAGIVAFLVLLIGAAWLIRFIRRKMKERAESYTSPENSESTDHL